MILPTLIAEDAQDRLVASLVALAKYNIPPDVQELLVHGNPTMGVPPGALAAALPPKIGAPKHVSNVDRFYSDPVTTFRAMADSTFPSETIDGAHFRMWCSVAANEILTALAALKAETERADKAEAAITGAIAEMKLMAAEGENDSADVKSFYRGVSSAIDTLGIYFARYLQSRKENTNDNG